MIMIWRGTNTLLMVVLAGVILGVNAHAREKSGTNNPEFSRCENRCASKYLEGGTGLPSSVSGYQKCVTNCNRVYPRVLSPR